MRKLFPREEKHDKGDWGGQEGLWRHLQHERRGRRRGTSFNQPPREKKEGDIMTKRKGEKRWRKRSQKLWWRLSSPPLGSNKGVSYRSCNRKRD